MTVALHLPDPAAADRLLEAMRTDMPLLAFMDIAVASCEGGTLTLKAPLQPNRNDKGTGFAGSLASLSTLSGWALLMLWAEAQGLPCQVAVYHTEIHYRRPVVADFQATATLPSDEVMLALRDQLLIKAKGRVTLSTRVPAADGQAVEQMASYALWRVSAQ